MIFDTKPKASNYPDIELPKGISWKDCIVLKGKNLVITEKLVDSELAKLWLSLYTRKGIEEQSEENRVFYDEDILKLAKQRNLSETNLDYICEELGSGEWFEIGDFARFSKKPVFMLDVQHRLHAIIKTGVPINFNIVIGLDHKAFEKIDTGKARNAADVLYSIGVSNYITTAGAARFVINYDREIFSSLGKSRGRSVSNSHIVRFVESNPDFVTYVNECNSKYQKAEHQDRLITPRIHAGLGWVMIKKGHDKEFVEYFFDRIYDGLKLDRETNPIYIIRNELSKSKNNSLFKIPTNIKIGLICEAFNNYYQNKNIKKLEYKMNEEFPRILDKTKVRKLKKVV